MLPFFLRAVPSCLAGHRGRGGQGTLGWRLGSEMVEPGTPCVYEPAPTWGAGQSRRRNRKSLLGSVGACGRGSCCGHTGSEAVPSSALG